MEWKPYSAICASVEELIGVDNMILYSSQYDKVRCIKTKQPKFSNRNTGWDCITGNVDGKNIKFWFTVKNNRGYFYFIYCDEWYKTQIVNSDGFDLWDWLYEHGEDLYTVLS